ncbi:MAG: hypothetical protein ACE5NN_05210 [Candidatus Bathyarchaeia archaeon]
MRGFDDLFLETIEDILKWVLGEAPAKIVLQRMKKVGSLKSKRVEVLEDALQKILGQGAGLIIEDLILRSLYSRLELKFERIQGYTFSDYVKELRRKCGQLADS